MTITDMTESDRIEDGEWHEDDAEEVTFVDDDDGEWHEDDVEEVIFLDNDDGELGESSSSEDENATARPLDLRDDSEFVFQKHTGPVFCCALEPKNGNLAVTGGEDDKAYVWEIENGQVLFQCYGHKDSVTFASFSFDGTYVVTGDMSGVIVVWKVATHCAVWSESVGDIAWLQWHHGTNALLCALTTGEIFMWKIPSGECKVFPGHGANTECGVIMPDGRRAAVGYSDGVVKMFELRSCTVQGTVTAAEAHSHVSCMDAYSDNNLIATGGGDGRVILYKGQPLKVLWHFDCNQQNEPKSYVEAIGFNKDVTLPLLAAGTLSGRLYILDFTKQVLRHKYEQNPGICRLVWDHSSSVVFVGGLEGDLRIFDARSGVLQGILHGHKENILDICLSMDGNTLLSASDDTTCRVFAVSSPER